MKIISVWIFLEVFALLPYFHAQHTNDHTHLAEKGGVPYVNFDNMSLFLPALTSLLISWSVSCVFCAVRKWMSTVWAVHKTACCSSWEEWLFSVEQAGSGGWACWENGSWTSVVEMCRLKAGWHLAPWLLWLSKKGLFKGPLYPYRFCLFFQLILSGTGGKIKGPCHVCCIWSSPTVVKILKVY